LATARNLIASKAYVSILDLSAPPETAFPETWQKDRILFVKMNITKTEDVQNGVNRTVEWTKATGAALGGVINCAGIGKNELVSRCISP